MTWLEIKRDIESQGVIDTDEIEYIDISYSDDIFVLITPTKTGRTVTINN